MTMTFPRIIQSMKVVLFVLVLLGITPATSSALETTTLLEWSITGQGTAQITRASTGEEFAITCKPVDSSGKTTCLGNHEFADPAALDPADHLLVRITPANCWHVSSLNAVGLETVTKDPRVVRIPLGGRSGASRTLRVEFVRNPCDSSAPAKPVQPLQPAQSAETASKDYAGIRPKPMFKTPGGAAYCYIDAVNMNDMSPSLNCWTPNDGFVVFLGQSNSKPYTDYYDSDPKTVDGLANLKGYSPASKTIAFGKSIKITCRNASDSSTCGNGSNGTVVFTCESQRSGLSCSNSAGRGFWIGRYKGFKVT